MDGFRDVTKGSFAVPGVASHGSGGRGRAGLGVLLAAGASLALLAGLSLTGRPAEAAFPGLNGRIACEGFRPVGTTVRREIFSINPDGTDERQLTNNLVTDQDPRYSPDGTRIVFASTREDSRSEIYVGNADGDLNGPDVRRLTFTPGGHRQPSFSPDGREIVFHSGRAAEFPAPIGTVPDVEIYKISATEGEGGPVGSPQRREPQRLTTTRGQDAIPTWSQDGRIVFQTLREALLGDNSQNLEIYTMNPDGSDQRNISTNPGSANDPATPQNENSNGLDAFPHTSPDGTEIAFGSTRDRTVPGNQNFEIYKMNRDGTNQRRLTLNASGDTPAPQPFIDYDHVPSWSPDGTRIIFHSGRTSTAAGDEFVAYTMDANAGEAAGLQRLAPTADFARCDWQPRARPATPPPPPSQPAARAPRVSASRAPRGCASRAFRVRVSSDTPTRTTTVSLDGRRIRRSGAASFTVRLPRRLRTGRHRLTVVTTDAAGNRTRRVFRFRACAARVRFTG